MKTIKNKQQDKETIGNAVSEINNAAKACNVEPIVIHVAKFLGKSNKRDEVYKWIDAHIGDVMGVPIVRKEKQA